VSSVGGAKGAFHFFAHRREMVEYRKKTRKEAKE
jgi:hypothetical protein